MRPLADAGLGSLKFVGLVVSLVLHVGIRLYCNSLTVLAVRGQIFFIVLLGHGGEDMLLLKWFDLPMHQFVRLC